MLLEDDCPSFVVIGLGVSAQEIAYCNSLQLRGVYRSVWMSSLVSGGSTFYQYEKQGNNRHLWFDSVLVSGNF